MYNQDNNNHNESGKESEKENDILYIVKKVLADQPLSKEEKVALEKHYKLPSGDKTVTENVLGSPSNNQDVATLATGPQTESFESDNSCTHNDHVEPRTEFKVQFTWKKPDTVPGERRVDETKTKTPKPRKSSDSTTSDKRTVSGSKTHLSPAKVNTPLVSERGSSGGAVRRKRRKPSESEPLEEVKNLRETVTPPLNVDCAPVDLSCGVPADPCSFKQVGTSDDLKICEDDESSREIPKKNSNKSKRKSAPHLLPQSSPKKKKASPKSTSSNLIDHASEGPPAVHQSKNDLTLESSNDDSYVWESTIPDINNPTVKLTRISYSEIMKATSGKTRDGQSLTPSKCRPMPESRKKKEAQMRQVSKDETHIFKTPDTPSITAPSTSKANKPPRKEDLNSAFKTPRIPSKPKPKANATKKLPNEVRDSKKDTVKERKREQSKIEKFVSSQVVGASTSQSSYLSEYGLAKPSKTKDYFKKLDDEADELDYDPDYDDDAMSIFAESTMLEDMLSPDEIPQAESRSPNDDVDSVASCGSIESRSLSDFEEGEVVDEEASTGCTESLSESSRINHPTESGLGVPVETYVDSLSVEAVVQPVKLLEDESALKSVSNSDPTLQFAGNASSLSSNNTVLNSKTDVISNNNQDTDLPSTVLGLLSSNNLHEGKESGEKTNPPSPDKERYLTAPKESTICAHIENLAGEVDPVPTENTLSQEGNCGHVIGTSIESLAKDISSVLNRVSSLDTSGRLPFTGLQNIEQITESQPPIHTARQSGIHQEEKRNWHTEQRPQVSSVLFSPPKKISHEKPSPLPTPLPKMSQHSNLNIPHSVSRRIPPRQGLLPTPSISQDSNCSMTLVAQDLDKDRDMASNAQWDAGEQSQSFPFLKARNSSQSAVSLHSAEHHQNQRVYSPGNNAEYLKHSQSDNNLRIQNGDSRRPSGASDRVRELQEYIASYCKNYLKSGMCDNKSCNLTHELPVVKWADVPAKLRAEYITTIIASREFWMQESFAQIAEELGIINDKVTLKLICGSLWKRETKNLKTSKLYWQIVARAFCSSGLSPTKSVKEMLSSICQLQTLRHHYNVLDAIIDALYLEFMKGKSNVWTAIEVLGRLENYELPADVLQEALRDRLRNRRTSHVDAPICRYLLRTPKASVPRTQADKDLLNLIHSFIHVLGGNNTIIELRQELLRHFDMHEPCCNVPPNCPPKSQKKRSHRRFSLFAESQSIIGDPSMNVEVGPLANTWGSQSIIGDPSMNVEVGPLANTWGSQSIIGDPSMNVEVGPLANTWGSQSIIGDPSMNIEVGPLANTWGSTSSTGLISEPLNQATQPSNEICLQETIVASTNKESLSQKHSTIAPLKIVVKGSERNVEEWPQSTSLEASPTAPLSLTSHVIESGGNNLNDAPVGASNVIPRKRRPLFQKDVTTVLQRGKIGTASSQIISWRTLNDCNEGSVSIFKVLQEFEPAKILEQFGTLIRTVKNRLIGLSSDKLVQAALMQAGLFLLEDCLLKNRKEAALIREMLWKEFKPLELNTPSFSNSHKVFLYAQALIISGKIKDAIEIVKGNNFSERRENWFLSSVEGDLKIRDRVFLALYEKALSFPAFIDHLESLFRQILQAKESYDFDLGSLYDKILSALIKAGKIEKACNLLTYTLNEHNLKPFNPLVKRMLLASINSLSEEEKKKYTGEVVFILSESPYSEAIPESIEGVRRVVLTVISDWLTSEVRCLISFFLSCHIANLPHDEEIPEIAVEIKEAESVTPLEGFPTPDPSVPAMEGRVLEVLRNDLAIYNSNFNNRVINLDSHRVQHIVERKREVLLQNPTNHINMAGPQSSRGRDLLRVTRGQPHGRSDPGYRNYHPSPQDFIPQDVGPARSHRQEQWAQPFHQDDISFQPSPDDLRFRVSQRNAQREQGYPLNNMSSQEMWQPNRGVRGARHSRGRRRGGATNWQRTYQNDFPQPQFQGPPTRQSNYW